MQENNWYKVMLMRRFFVYISVLCFILILTATTFFAADGVGNSINDDIIVDSDNTSYSYLNKESTILDSGKCGESLYWELDSNGLLRIFGEGKMYDFNKYFEPSPWYKYRAEPYISEDGAYILDKDGSVYLPAEDYYANNPNGFKISEIIIESGITYIGDWAFYRVCVEEITVPETVESVGIFCFRYSPTLKELSLPNSLKVLDDYAVSRNYELETVNIGNSLETVGVAGFNNNPSLKQLILPETCTTINVQQSPAYSNIDYSKVGLLENCSLLKYVCFGSVTEIPQRTCLGTAIETVVIPNTVKSIGDYAFYSCKNLKTVIFEEGSVCKTIANNSFTSCSSLESVTGGTSLEKMGIYTSTNSLAEFEFSSTNAELQKSQFLGTSLKEVVVSDKITVIPVSCFNNMKSLERIYLPDTITEIMASSFNFCESLIDVYYDGTLAQWVNIKKASGWSYKINSECMLHLSDGTTVSLWYTPKQYSVTFADFDGAVIEVQQIVEGYGATAPVVPEKEGYVFVGWDTDFEYVTSDITVNAVYDKIEVPIVSSIGKLKIELIGGTSFRIAVDGGVSRPQGTMYINTKMPVGSTVTIVASSNANTEFLGWMNEAGAFVSLSDIYTFTTSGNDYLKAVYVAEIEGVNLVTFKNGKAAGGKGQILDMQYYASGDDILFPDAPVQAGYDFAGWSMTEAEIQTALANGEDVTVTATWTVAKKYITITVNGGELIAGNITDGKALAYNAYTVSAYAAAEGQKFAYWTDAAGRVISYNAEYKFYPADDIILIAVYVAEDAEIEYVPLAFIVADPSTSGEKITYIISWDVSYVGSIVSVGLMTVNESDYKEDTFYHGTSDGTVFDRGLSSDIVKDANTYSITKAGSYYDNTYVACCWVVYKDANGVEHTIYSDINVTYKPAP